MRPCCPAHLPLVALAAFSCLGLAACQDYTAAPRVEAVPDQIPADEDCRFEASDPWMPISRASWLAPVEGVAPRHWPLSMYEDFRQHVGRKRALGARAPEWPSGRHDRWHVAEFREPLHSDVARLDGHRFLVISQIMWQKSAARPGRAGGTFHRLWLVDVDAATAHVIADDVEGVRSTETLEFRVQAFGDRVVILFATMRDIQQVTARVEAGTLQFTPPVAISRLEAPPIDLHLGETTDRLHLAWTQGPLDAPARALVYASTADPIRGWSEPQTVADDALAGTLDLVCDEQAAWLGWVDLRFGTQDPESTDPAPRVVVAPVANGAAPPRPILTSDLSDPRDIARQLRLALAGDDLVLYWSPEPAGTWPESWQKGLLDRTHQTFRPAGTVRGEDLLAAYRKHMIAALTAQLSAPTRSASHPGGF